MQKRGLLSSLSLDLPPTLKKETRWKRRQYNDCHNREREDSDRSQAEVPDQDYPGPISSQGGTICSYGRNEDMANEQQWADNIPLQDVGKLLSVLR